MKARTPRLLAAAAGLLILIAIVLFVSTRGNSPAPVEQFTQRLQTSPANAVEQDSSPVLPETHGQLETVPSPAPIKHESVLPAKSQGASELIAQLADSSAPLRQRKIAARQLAQIGTDEAFLALKQALVNAPVALQAAIAEALGSCSHPGAGELLASLLQSPIEEVALGAVRGLGASKTAEAAWTLIGLLADASRTASFRAEVVDALAQTQQPHALQTLTRTAFQPADGMFMESVLHGIASFPFSDTEAFFESFLQSSQVSLESRVAALENLQNAGGRAGEFLLRYVRNSDPEIRLAASQALASAEERGSLGSSIASALIESNDESVRAALYHALSFQSDWDLPTLWPAIQKEADPATRVAALSLAAEATRTTQTPEMVAFFNEHILAELKQTALTAPDFDTQFQAAIALRAAGTAQALSAVEEIARDSKNPRLIQALASSSGSVTKATQ